MTLSLTGEYGVRAVMELARHPDAWPMPRTRIAEGADIPARYLSRILTDLVRAGVLDASRGKRGGFRLARSASDISLYDVLSPFERFESDRCPFGSGACGEANPCEAHNGWKELVEHQRRFLRRTTVHDISKNAQGNGAEVSSTRESASTSVERRGVLG